MVVPIQQALAEESTTEMPKKKKDEKPMDIVEEAIAKAKELEEKEPEPEKEAPVVPGQLSIDSAWPTRLPIPWARRRVQNRCANSAGQVSCECIP